MHEQPACPGARLPGERKTALHGEIYRLVEVGILHEDERVLAAELHLRARGERRAPMDLLARGSGPREGDRAHRGRGGDDRSDFSGRAGDEVEHAFRQSARDERFREPVAAQRRVGGGLEHHRVAADKGRRDLARGDRDGEVPRRDDGDDAERLAHRVDQHVGVVLREALAAERLAFDRVEAQRLRRAQELVFCERDRFPFLARHLLRKPRRVRLKVIGCTEQHLRALRDRCLAPGVESRGGRRHRGARVGGGGGLEAADDVARVGRVHVVEGLAGRARRRLAADEVAKFAHACSSARSACGTCASAMSSSERGRCYQA